jgi:TRAP-type uncharacterized transport system substrate-binding protein
MRQSGRDCGRVSRLVGSRYLQSAAHRLLSSFGAGQCHRRPFCWRSVAAATALAVAIGAVPSRVVAQVIPKSLQEATPDEEIKQRKNAWTVGMVGGLMEGTYMRFAHEIAKVLDDGDNLRVLPIVSYGAAGNLDDLLYLRGVDVAVTQSDVFEYFRTVRKTPNLDQRVNYIIRLPISEVHILARQDIRTIEDLRGKKVNLGPEGSASSLTGTIIFQRLGIEIQQTNIDGSLALQALKSGELSALVRVVGKPVDFLTRIPANSGVHLLQIPFSKKFADYYTLGELDSKDYPTLIPEGQRIDTIAVPAVLAVYNWPKGKDRYQRVQRFTERLFENWDKFQKPPFHPKWRDINLAATVPGWNRFSVAEDMLQKVRKTMGQSSETLKRDFDTFLASSRREPRNEAEQEALFREFMSWREKQGRAAR